MSQHQFVEDEDVPAARPQKLSGGNLIAGGTSLFGLVTFGVAAGIVIMTLLGNTNQPLSVAAYFLNGNTVIMGRHSLDLSRPIFLKGSMPVCPDSDALSHFSASNPNGCTLTQSTQPASLVAIITDGMKQPSFQMQLGKGPSAVRGWVDYSNLTN